MNTFLKRRHGASKIAAAQQERAEAAVGFPIGGSDTDGGLEFLAGGGEVSLLEQSSAQRTARQGMIRLQLDRPAKCLYGFAGLSLFRERQTKIVVRFGILGILAGGLTQ